MSRSIAEIATDWSLYGKSHAVYPSLWDGANVLSTIGPSDSSNAVRDFCLNRFGSMSDVILPVWRKFQHRGGSFSGVNFVATSSQYITHGHHVALNPGTGNYTVSCWVRTTAASGVFAGKRNLFTEGAPDNRGFILYISSDKLRFLIGVTGANYSVTSLGNVNDGAWHHCAGVRRGSTVECWLDGVMATAAGSALDVPSANPFCIGSQTPTNGHMTGDVAGVHVWQRGLSAPEIEILGIHPLEAYRVHAPTVFAVSFGLAELLLTGSVSMDFDATGALSALTALAGDVALDFDVATTPTAFVSVSGTTSLDLDAAGSLSSLSSLTGSAEIEIHASGLPTALVSLTGSVALDLAAAGDLTIDVETLTITGRTITVTAPFNLGKVVGDVYADVSGGTAPYISFSIISQTKQGA